MGEILTGVVDHVVCSDRPEQFDISGAAHPRDASAKRFGNLHGKGSHPARCTIDENSLPCVNFSFVAYSLQRGDSRDWQACGFFKRNLLRFHGKLRHGSARIFRKEPLAVPKTASPGLSGATLAPTASTT